MKTERVKGEVRRWTGMVGNRRMRHVVNLVIVLGLLNVDRLSVIIDVYLRRNLVHCSRVNVRLSQSLPITTGTSAY